MATVDPWTIEILLAAFAGGAFGAAIGALPAFSLAGVMVVVGEAYELSLRSDPATLPSVDITGSIGFGVVLGPHVAFGGGAAALAYAARRGYLDSEFEYHPAKEVTAGLGSRADVLGIGGIFGVLGHGVASASAGLAVPVDPVALGVVGSAVAHRLVFGYSLVGAPVGDLLDMGPAEGDGDPGSPTARSAVGRRTVEPWLPYQSRWGDVLAIGICGGLLGGYVAYLTGSPFLAFGISVTALVFMNAGVERIPVTHHITLPASTAVLALAGGPGSTLTGSPVVGSLPLGVALLVGAGFGALGGGVGELSQRVFYARAETHFDPPAASIVVTTFLVALLAMAGVFPSASWIPLP